MKQLIAGILSLTVLIAGGAFLYSRLSPSLGTKDVKAVSELEAALTLPPMVSEALPVVNQDRLQNIAGENPNGLSYAVTPAEMDQMVAEQRLADPSKRLPANEKKGQ